MTIEAAKPQDTPQKVAKVESQPVAPLQSEASTDLSSKPIKTSESAANRPEVKPDVQPEVSKPEAVRPEVVKPLDKADKADNNDKSEKTEKSEKSEKSEKTEKTDKTDMTETAVLTTELRSAVDRASKVIVKMPSAGSDNSDVIIKADGKIQQNLNMDPQKPDSQNLVIAFEQKDPSTQGLSKEQADALQKLMKYVKEKDKEFTVDAPDQPLEKEVKVPNVEVPVVKADEPAKVQSRVESPEPQSVNPAQPSNSYSPSSYSPNSYASRGGSDTSSSGDYSSSNSYYSAPQDLSQVNMSELLMEWFAADPEKFKKLFPELFKKISGADGKIDLAKLQMLQKSNDPMLASMKESLPGLVSEFPPTKALSGGPASLSADAVNSTGAKLSDKAAQVADELSGSGYCAKGVSLAIERATGKTIYGNANDMRETLPSHGFTEASNKELKVGQVVHLYWTPEVYAQERAKRGDCPNYGDIAVIGKGKDGKLYAFNDNAIPLDDYLKKTRYDKNSLKVFNPPATA